MWLKNDSRRPDGCFWHCKRCFKYVSTRCGSLFSCGKLSLNLKMILLKKFFNKEPALLAALNMELNYNTVRSQYKLFREYEAQAFRQLFTPLGGPGEALFRNRKYHRGRILCTFWILGFVCRSSGKTIFISVLNRKIATIKFFIEKLVLPGTAIYTDSYASYNFI
eukprot:NODE_133_length_16612_cov_1.402531.p6 type:complete len:165 gc:universal NODE_133_length_16612_cov_1.402531:15058-14564(-)